MPTMCKLIALLFYSLLMQATQIQNLRASPPSERLYFAFLKREMSHERSFCNIHSLVKYVSDALVGVILTTSAADMGIFQCLSSEDTEALYTDSLM